MRVFATICLGLTVWAVQGLANKSCAQDFAPRIASRSVGADAPRSEKFTLILFWKQNDAATQKMSEALKSSLAKRTDRATSIAVNIADPANQAIVEQYKVSRAPMPMVLCIAPNGAITGGIPDRTTDEAVDRVLVTPTMTLCMKALQDGKLVLVHVRPDDKTKLPIGANDFAADPEFHARTVAVSFHRDDPNETRFLKDMEINPATANGSIVSLLAPPGVLVGKFSATATKDQIAEQLHAAGKCCDDPNCIHNKKGK